MDEWQLRINALLYHHIGLTVANKRGSYEKSSRNQPYLVLNNNNYLDGCDQVYVYPRCSTHRSTSTFSSSIRVCIQPHLRLHYASRNRNHNAIKLIRAISSFSPSFLFFVSFFCFSFFFLDFHLSPSSCWLLLGLPLRSPADIYIVPVKI